MKEVYEFIDRVRFIVDDYFNFFYGKKAEDFKTSTFETVGDYNLFRGRSKGITSREKEFENRFYWQIEDYINDKASLNVYDYLCKIENVMFSSDNVGRRVLANRITKKIDDAIAVGKYGFFEMGAFSEIGSSAICDILGRSFNRYNVEEKIIDCFDGIDWVSSSFYVFVGEFKSLCDDFNIEIKGNIDVFLDLVLSEVSKEKGLKRAERVRDGFAHLFRSPWQNHLDQFEKALNTHGYIIGKQWVGENGRKSELAELYYYLKMENIIAQGEESRQLNALYAEFGLSVGKDNTKNGEYCTLRALRKANGDSDTKERFEHILKSWVNRRFTAKI